MVTVLSSKLSCLFLVGGVLCAGQPERTAAVQWANYYAAMCGVPPELIEAIIEIESGWQPHAISNRGAAGLMQLMPATAATFGVTNRFEAEQNIRGGVVYLARLLRLFHWDLRLATAAYVAGEHRILTRGLRYSNVDVFEYVSKVARLYQQRRLQRIQMNLFAEAGAKGGNSP
jgi:soluble lytic murein transglycosylase-like protein